MLLQAVKIQELEAALSRVPAFSQSEYDARVAELASKDNELRISNAARETLVRAVWDSSRFSDLVKTLFFSFQARKMQELEAASKARGDAENRMLGERDGIQSKYFNLLADELGQACGREPNLIDIKQRVATHFDGLWKGMVNIGSKTRIAKAFDDLICNISRLRDEAAQASINVGYAEGRYCSGCSERFGRGGTQKKRRNDGW